MESNNIAHFDEKVIAYYQGLVKHLGTSARYQLLGNLFANQSIAGMDNRIPAIRGEMGGHTYGSRWVKEVPTPVYTDASTEASKAFRETGEEKEFWDFVNLAGCKDIILYGRHWLQLFETQFTLDSEKKKPGGKSVKTEWLTMVYKFQNKAGKANFSVPKND